MTIRQIVRVARLFAKHHGTQYGARYMRSSGLPVGFAVVALTRGKR